MKEHLTNTYCNCNLCRNKKQSEQKQIFEPVTCGKNCLNQFLNYLPRNFPIFIVPTSFQNQKLHYYNKYKNRLSHHGFLKVTENFPLAVHIILYYEKQTIICYKYDILKHNQNFLYLQAYQTNPPISYVFKKDQQNQLDNILKQKLQIHLKQMIQDQYHSFSQKQKGSLKWIHKQYGDQIYVAYMTNLFCSFINFRSNKKILKGTFDWIVEGIEQIRLLNVRDISIKINKKNFSFQDQYQQHIMQKLKNLQMKQISLINPQKQKFQSNQRVKTFKKRMKQIYDQQKGKLLQQTQQERMIQSKTMSDEVGRYFLPGLKNYSSLREVLNNQQIFKKVVLGKRNRNRVKSTQKLKSKIKGDKSYRIKTQH